MFRRAVFCRHHVFVSQRRDEQIQSLDCRRLFHEQWQALHKPSSWMMVRCKVHVHSLPSHHYQCIPKLLELEEAINLLQDQWAWLKSFQVTAGERDDNFGGVVDRANHRSEEHTSELQSLMRNSYAVFCLKK